jgi:hypothetical protein
VIVIGSRITVCKAPKISLSRIYFRDGKAGEGASPLKHSGLTGPLCCGFVSRGDFRITGKLAYHCTWKLSSLAKVFLPQFSHHLSQHHIWWKTCFDGLSLGLGSLFLSLHTYTGFEMSTWPDWDELLHIRKTYQSQIYSFLRLKFKMPLIVLKLI